MKRDGRKISHETSETIRLIAVKRVKEGEKPRDVIRSFGMCRTSIYRWLRAEKQGGKKALRARKHPGPQRKLSRDGQRLVYRLVCGKDPRRYGFEAGLWTRQIVADLIEKKTRKKISISSTGRLLHEIGITPQKPLRRAYERDPKAVEKWKNEDFPNIKKLAKKRSADVFFLDEAGIRSDAPLQRTWGAEGKTPVVQTSGQRQSINAMSAVNMRGGFWYTTYTGTLKGQRFVEFLKEFMKTRRMPVMLIIDRHPSHIAKVVKDYVKGAKGKLEIYFLPGYAPELNPDEFVWNHLRQRGTSKKPLRQNESLAARVKSDLSAIKSDRSLVRSIFYAPSVAYTMA